MKCEKCGCEIDRISTREFMRDGSDAEDLPYIVENEISDYVFFETDANWCGYELMEEEMIELIRCPNCGKFPFKHEEVQVYDVVRVVCFKTKVGEQNEKTT